LNGRQRRLEPQIDMLLEYVPLAGEIEGFWLEAVHQAAGSWLAHRDIDRVMLATSLVPDGYLEM
jgi:hypothetical protein